MVNVKTYRDGERFILVVENCTGEVAGKVNAFLLDLLGTAPAVTDVPDVLPEKVPEESVPNTEDCTPIVAGDEAPFEEPIPARTAQFVAVRGNSGTLGRAIEEQDTEAIVDLCLRANELDKATQYTVLDLCKEYIRKDCQRRDPDYSPTREIEQFCRVYEPLLRPAIKQILGSAGFANLRDFFALTDEYIHQDAYRRILEYLIERVSN